MDQIKIGRYIAGKRKSLNLTQSQIAEKLGVTDKSVSKWERGVCLPDVSLYQDLCRELGITINEFFAGEDIEREEIETRSEENIMGVAVDSSNRRKKLRRIIIALAIVAALLASGTIYAVHFISEKGYFMKNYVRVYDATETENAMKEIMSASGSDTQLLKYDVDDSYKSMTLIIKTYKGNKLISSEDPFQVEFQNPADRQGIIAVMADYENGTSSITVATKESNASAEGIELMSPKDTSDFDSSGWSLMSGPINVTRGEEIPMAAFYMCRNYLNALPAEDIMDVYAEEETVNDNTFLYLVKFE